MVASRAAEASRPPPSAGERGEKAGSFRGLIGKPYDHKVLSRPGSCGGEVRVLALQGVMADQKPKLATELPPPPPLTDADMEQIDKEARKLVEAVDAHTASLDRLNDADLRIRLR